MGFVSRARERDEILEMLRAGNGGAIAVIGGRGAGTTTLLREITHAVELPSVFVPVSPGEAAWPLSGLSAFLAAVDGAQQSHLVAMLNAQEDEESEFALARALSPSFHAALAAELVIVVDDADLMDERSQRILGFLLRRLGRPSAQIVLGMAAMPPGGPFEGVPEVHLGPLGFSRLIELGRNVLPVTVSPSVLDFVARVSGGSTAAFLSLLGELSETQLEGEDPLPLPLRLDARLQDEVMEETAQLSAGALRALRMLSTSYTLPAAALCSIPGAAAADVDELTARGLAVRRGDDLLVAESPLHLAVYWSMPSHVRVGAHRELADACEAVDGGLHAWHLSHIDPSPRLAAPLLIAAREKIEAGEILVGIRFAERAVSLRAGTAVVPRLEELVSSLLLAAEVDAARRYLKVILGSTPDSGTTPFTGALRIAVDVLQSQSLNEDIVSGVLADHAQDDPLGCASLLCASAVARLCRWDIGRAQEDIAQSLALGGAAVPSIRALSTIIQLYADADAGTPLPGMPELQALMEPMPSLGSLAPAQLLIAGALLLGERYEDARRLLDIVRDYSGGLAPLAIALSLDSRYALELREGRVDHMGEVIEFMARGVPGREVFPISRALRVAETAFLQGDLERAREALDLSRRRVHAGASAFIRARIVQIGARLAMAEHDDAAAAHAFSQADEIAKGLLNPQLLRYHDSYIAVLVRRGRRDEARGVLADFRRRAEVTPSGWARRALARSEALLQDDPASLDAFQELLGSWPEGRDHLLQARVLWDYGERLQRLGHDRRYRAVRQQELALLRSMGCGLPSEVSEPWEAPAPSEEAVSDPVPEQESSPTLFDFLTAKERPVVELVVKGRRNQSIARELFLSQRTVELRLTSVYRKLGVANRLELSKLLGEQPGADGGGAAGADGAGRVGGAGTAEHSAASPAEHSAGTGADRTRSVSG